MKRIFKYRHSIINNIITDILATIGLWRYSLYLVYLKLSLKYKNSFIGVLWESLIVLMVSFVLSFLWFNILNMHDYVSYFLYVFSGFIVWTFMSTIVSKTISSLSRNQGNILNLQLPLSIYIFEDCLYALMVLCINMVVFIVVIVFVPEGEVPHILEVLISISIIFVSGVGFGLSFGVWSYIYKDLQYFVTTAMKFGFLATPIIWHTDRLGENEYLIWFNPFYSFLDMARRALLGLEFSVKSLWISLIVMCCLVFLGVLTFSMNMSNVRKTANIK